MCNICFDTGVRDFHLEIIEDFNAVAVDPSASVVVNTFIFGLIISLSFPKPMEYLLRFFAAGFKCSLNTRYLHD